MPQPKQKVSEKKRLANQRNAQKSTGPRTPEGKAKSSQNARTHGLFCQEIVLLYEDRSLFKQFRLQLIRELKPQLLIELSMVDKIIECQWKMRRLRVNEAFRCEKVLKKHLEETGRAGMEKISDDHPDYCAPLAMGLLLERGEDGLERISRYEQRLQNQVHKCLRDLRLLRQEQEKLAALPDSPFEETVEETACDWEEQAAKEAQEAETKSGEQDNDSTDLAEVCRDELTERSQVEADGQALSPTVSPRKGQGEMQNEATDGRSGDGDVTCDPPVFRGPDSQGADPSSFSPPPSDTFSWRNAIATSDNCKDQARDRRG